MAGKLENSLIPLIAEFERAYKHFNQELFDGRLNEKVYITIQTRGKKPAYAWFSGDRWENGTDKICEINMAPETMKRDDGSTPFQSLIHEMAHHSNFINKIKDCARSGNYHNKNFKTAAEEAGLIVTKTEKSGFSMTSLGPKAVASLNNLKPKYELLDCLRLQNPPTESKSNLKKWTCGCQNVWAKTEIKAACLDCGAVFVEG